MPFSTLIIGQQTIVMIGLYDINQDQRMNLLRTALRVKLGLANPYQINPKFKVFQQPEGNTVRARLLSKSQLNKDHYVIRFELPEPDKCLGLRIGQYVWLQIQGERRPYVPISAIDQPQFVDLLVRDMSAKNQNSFSSRLLQLQPSDSVMIEGPGTQFVYSGFGQLHYTHPETNQAVERRFKNIGIITHSSAITTTYSLIESIAERYDQRTGISLLWLGDDSQDFVFVEQFSSYVEQCKLNMNLMLTKFEKGWLGPYGRLNKHYLQQFMPQPSDDTLVIMSGLEGDQAAIPELVRSSGYRHYLNF